MPRRKLVEEELKEEHKLILDIMSKDESLSYMEIAERFIQKYPDHEQVLRWHSHVGDVCRYVIVRYMAFLRNRGYIEPDPVNPEKWRKVRERPLLREVAEAYVFLEKADSVEKAISKLAQEYVSKLEPYFQNLVKKVNEAKEAIEEEEQLRRKASLEAQQILDQISRISLKKQ